MLQQRHDELGKLPDDREDVGFCDDQRGEAGGTGAIVFARGKAEPNDKTMVDALLPARDAFARTVAGGGSFADALRAAAIGAEEGMRATIPLVAKKGRASYLGERSAGHQDPGATSSQMLMQAAADAFGG